MRPFLAGCPVVGKFWPYFGSFCFFLPFSHMTLCTCKEVWFSRVNLQSACTTQMGVHRPVPTCCGGMLVPASFWTPSLACKVSQPSIAPGEQAGVGQPCSRPALTVSVQQKLTAGRHCQGCPSVADQQSFGEVFGGLSYKLRNLNQPC